MQENSTSIPEILKSLHADAVLWKAARLWTNATDPDSQAIALEQITTMLMAIKNEAKRNSYVNLVVEEQAKKAKHLKQELATVQKQVEQKEKTIGKLRAKGALNENEKFYLQAAEENLEELLAYRAELNAQSTTDIPLPLLRKQLKEAERKKKAELDALKSQAQFEKKIKSADDAGLPSDFEGGLTDIYDAIKYGIYEHEGIIWSRGGRGGDQAISNFTMKIIYHSHSNSDVAYRLVAVKNVYGIEKTILFNTDDFVTTGSMKKVLARHGDFVFRGQDSDLSRLQERLQKDEIKAHFIDKMGWNKRGHFYAFANGLVTADGTNSFVPVDHHGIVEYHNKSYFIPAMSEMFAEKDDMFVNEKRFVYRLPVTGFGFKEWSQLFYQVYGEKAMIAIPFYLGALYRDIIFKQIQRYPLLNLYGPPGAGKGELAESMMYMFGEKQDPIPLEAGSTNVGMQRKLAFLSNALGWLDEYKNSLDKKMIGALKSLYDGQGRVTGLKTNDLQTQAINVNSAVILSGQDMPTIEPALFTRCIMLAFQEGKFTEAQRNRFANLKNAEKEGGFSYITATLLHHRQLVESNFKDKFQVISKEIFKEVANVEIEDRMIVNISILLTMIHILQPEVALPFTYADAKGFMIKNLRYQHQILTGNNDVSKFWQIVEMLCHQLLIKEDREFKLEDGYLYIRLQHVHPLYLKEMRQRGDANYFSSVDSLRHYLSLDKQSYVDFKKARFPDGSNTTCDILRYEPLNIDLIRLHGDAFQSSDQKALAYKEKYKSMGISYDEDAKPPLSTANEIPTI